MQMKSKVRLNHIKPNQFSPNNSECIIMYNELSILAITCKTFSNRASMLSHAINKLLICAYFLLELGVKNLLEKNTYNLHYFTQHCSGFLTSTVHSDALIEIFPANQTF